ncbi:MAG: winged helix-turn-helix domain-containing protein [Planctomycetota bacterium]|jgi:DNA-binding MarR family transcriptional regulator
MAQLDNLIHQTVRLQIMSSLVGLDQNEQVNFTYLRKLLKLTDGNLGAHLSKLEQAGYIQIDKTFVARKPQTFISSTGKGRDAFTGHIAALEEIIHSGKD